MPNTPEAIIMFYATNMVGAIASMVHPLSAENEIEIYLNESESTLLFVLDLVYDKVHNIIDNTKIKNRFFLIIFPHFLFCKSQWDSVFLLFFLFV